MLEIADVKNGEFSRISRRAGETKKKYSHSLKKEGLLKNEIGSVAMSGEVYKVVVRNLETFRYTGASSTGRHPIR